MKRLIDNIENVEVKKLMIEFFNEANKLYDDMDSLSYNEFKVREKNMWDIRNKAQEIKGDYFLITLGGLSNKAVKLYGNEYIQDIGL